MRAPCQQVHHTGYRGRAKDAGIGLSDQGRPAGRAAPTADTARENLRKLARGAAAAGARKVPHLNLDGQRLAQRVGTLGGHARLGAGKYKRSRPSTSITVSSPAECACPMRRKPASVSSIVPSAWTTKSRPDRKSTR